MKLKRPKGLRGWVPKEPAISGIKSVNVNMKPERLVGLPFLASGTLGILASVLSAYFGFNLLMSYQT
jgi:hypothetical protein